MGNLGFSRIRHQPTTIVTNTEYYDFFLSISFIMEFLNKRSLCITRHVHCITRLSIIAPREPDLEIIKTNILTKSYDDYINNKDNEACLMDGEI